VKLVGTGGCRRSISRIKALRRGRALSSGQLGDVLSAREMVLISLRSEAWTDGYLAR
jgi:hypothetical protein